MSRLVTAQEAYERCLEYLLPMMHRRVVVMATRSELRDISLSVVGTLGMAEDIGEERRRRTREMIEKNQLSGEDALSMANRSPGGELMRFEIWDESGALLGAFEIAQERITQAIWLAQRSSLVITSGGFELLVTLLEGD